MVRVGVFGANPKGEQHIQNYIDIPGFELKGLYDPDLDAAKRISEQYNIPLFTTPDALIVSCDALDFELPAETHFDLLVRLLTQSKHLLVDYPVSLSLDKITQLNKLGREANVIIQVSNNDRLNPVIQAIQPSLKKPMYIEIRRNSKYAHDRRTDDSLRNILARDIDLALHLGQSNVQRVSATGVYLGNNRTDLINGRLEFYNGCVATLTCNTFSDSDGMICSIFQQGEWFVLDFTHNLITTFLAITQADNDGSFKNDNSSNSPVDSKEIIPQSVDPYQELIIFRDAIVNQQDPLVDMEEAYFTLKILYDLMERITEKT